MDNASEPGDPLPMGPDELWRDFGGDVDDALLGSLAAAFALVATADAEVAQTEVERFLEVVRNEPALGSVDADALEPPFRALTEALLADPAEGRRRALDVLRAVRTEHVPLVVAAAQMAVVADAHLVNVEELALAEVCRALGVDPSGA